MFCLLVLFLFRDVQNILTLPLWNHPEINTNPSEAQKLRDDKKDIGSPLATTSFVYL